ncbi:LuxR C-terminal-related transcriptional regulator [Kribbella sp. CA-293567]|uniref:LuxR C-terminal-related transcriptional regulator n=1 Tax=Kribbella sp. CA-293567 TaxID=3002436 RepID=UPI0022DD36BE|nr:LuxR C-terminal-related transcriptional regulator [Kribbella sp. CA-293567]WBQ08252.1 LuxR C-terminal-related transcriptional regulator [Kribbella sp. CA-293567]
MLRPLGLSADAEQVYRCLVQQPRTELPPLAERLGWSLARTEAGVEDLLELALVRYSWENPRELHLVSPEASLVPLLTQHELVLLDRQKEVVASRVAIEQILAEYGDRVASSGYADAERLVGVDNVRLRLEALISEVEFDLMGFSDGGPQSAESLEAARPLDQALLSRGVRMRVVYLESLVNDGPTARYVDWLSERGAQVRTVATLPLRMIVADRKAALVPMDATDSSQGALLIRDAGVVAALRALFEVIWEQSRIFGTCRPGRDAVGLTSQERAVVQLLAEGHTDEVVARRLGVSVRTCRRLMADLMVRLDARSRFQAGVAATRAGWLLDDDPLLSDPVSSDSA